MNARRAQSLFSMLIRRISARIDWLPASQVPGFPAPIAAETRAMPSHQRLRPDGRHCRHDRWKPPIQLEEEKAIAVRELDPTAHLALKHDQLTSECSVLRLKPADRPERRVPTRGRALVATQGALAAPLQRIDLEWLL
jgi:hypothetical protein